MDKTTTNDDPTLGRYQFLGGAEHHLSATAVCHFGNFLACHFFLLF
jgi:hypothetical protein